MSTPRGLVFVSSEMREAYQKELREVDARYPALSDAPDGMALAEHWEIVARMRAVARAEVRQALRQAAELAANNEGFEGVYPIAV